MDNKYVVYIDESGIHKGIDHSSFVFVYVEFTKIDSINSKVLEIESDLGIENFHWSDYSTKFGWKIRSKFVKLISKLDFTFKYVILNNPINTKLELNNVLINISKENFVGKICIDGKQVKQFERKMKKSFRDSGVSIKMIKHVDDKDEPIIRIADAIANVVRIHNDKPQKIVNNMYDSLLKKCNTKTKPPAP